MSNQSNNGTWREQRVRLQAATSDVVYFNDTNPNHILVSNPVGAPLYVGVNGNVNPAAYDLVIPPYGTRLYARMLGSPRLYIYSDSLEAVDVQVTSWEGDFNPSSIAQSQEMVGAGADGLLGVVEVNNILAPLPGGTNVIGGVVISGFDSILPTGSNLIGRVIIEEGQVQVTELPQDKASYVRVVAAAAGTQTVKVDEGYVYKLQSDDPDNVQLYDNAQPCWTKGNFDSAVPLHCQHSIRVNFTAAGEAFVLFK